MRAHVKLGTSLTGLLALWALSGCAAPGQPGRDGLVPLLEDIEDVRLLLCDSCYRIHELEALLLYGRGFGDAGLDPQEAQEWHRESLRVFEPLKSLDDGGQNLMAWADFRRHEGSLGEDVGILRGLLGRCAAATLAFHQHLDRRIAEVRARLAEIAKDKGLSRPREHRPKPWPSPHREIGRQMGFTPAWFVWMNRDPAGPHAALDRQQRMGTDILLKKAGKLGIRAIVPEFPGPGNRECCSWRVVEARQGSYDFSRIDANIAAIARHGLKVVIPIRSLTTGPPEWGKETFAPILRWDVKKKAAVPTDGVNLHDPATREAFLKYLAALARHLRQRHADKIVAVTLETRMAVLPGEIDYSPAAQGHFRRWLTGRYGTIEKLNALWGTKFASFDQVAIPPPRREAPLPATPGRADAPPATEGATWHDWIAWRKAWTATHFQCQADVLRRELPGVPIQAYALRADSHHAHSERPVASWPLEAMGELADLPSACATVEPVHVLLRAVGRGRYAGQQAEQNFGAMLGGAAYAAFLKDTLYTVARNGPEVILRYFYAAGLFGYMDRQINWDGAYSYRLKMQDMHRLAVQIENTAPAPTEIALLWSTQSYDQDARMYSRWGALGTAYAMMCAKVHYDIVLESDIRAGALKDYSLLVVPEQRYLDDATLERLRAFVRGGGTLYATGIPGMFDPRGRYRGHPLADVFGADLKAFTPIQAVPGTFLVPTHPNCTWDRRERGTRNYGRGFVPNEWTLDLQLCASLSPRKGAEVLRRFPDGSAAMVKNTFGKGTAVLLGYPFGHEYANTNTTEMCFGKIYPDFPYPPQMTALEAWLGEFLRKRLGHRQQVQVPRSWMDRFMGRQRHGPRLVYPGFGDTYETKVLETDQPNHSFAIGLRERDLGGGAKCTLLTVFNRDSAYAIGRGYMHYMASPTHAIIRLNRTDVKAVYDVLNRSYVPFVRGDLSRARRGTTPRRLPDAGKCVSFETLVPPYFGRVFAISTRPQVDLFADAAPRPAGITRAELVARVRGLARPWTPPEVLVWDKPAVKAWLGELPAPGERAIVISCGSGDYREAAELLAHALRKTGVEVRITTLPVKLAAYSTDPYYRYRQSQTARPVEQIDVFIGNDWDNSVLADFTGAWGATPHANPRLPVSINRHFPGRDRAVVMLTRPFFVRRPDWRTKRFDGGYHVFTDHRRELVIGAGTPAGALRGVRALLKLAP